MIIKLLFLFLSLFIYTSLVFSQGFNIPQPVFNAPKNNSFSQPKQQLQSLSHFMKSKYLGITVDYIDRNQKVKLDEEFNKERGDVVEIITNKEGHFLRLEDKIRLKIEYQVAQSGDPRFVSQMQGTDEQALQLQVLQTQAFINQSLASIGTDRAADASSSLVSNAQANSAQSQAPSFTSSEEIIYTDLRDGRKKKSGAIANLEGVFLTDGSPVVFKFVREKK
ncbi:hypothetical protein DID80_02480 [Candidatus Marinamargulisbacteria bacterium SCGC AAA071-K20]|nr:hypothetical protein DID80_02480 [Candidatus Marinamargulisbacteria bacterium SCGC AAA071-K20]